MGLSPYDASVLVAEKATAEYFELVAKGHDPKLAANWIMGVEPQLVRFDRAPITRTSFRDYMESARSQGYESVSDKALLAVVYPGARLGAYLHNELFAEEKESE